MGIQSEYIEQHLVPFKIYKNVVTHHATNIRVWDKRERYDPM
jgi:hypothetical protein